METTIERPRYIRVYSETLAVYPNGGVFEDGDKLILELEFNICEMSDKDLADELETLLYYSYQDNKE